MDLDKIEALGKVAKACRELVELSKEGVGFVSLGGLSEDSTGTELTLSVLEEDDTPRGRRRAARLNKLMPEELRKELRAIFTIAALEAAEKIEAHLRKAVL